MEVIAKLNYLRIAPRKVRLVIDLIRGKSVEQARTILDFTLNKSAGPVKKLLNSAVANAKNNLGLDEETLRIVKITADEGPKLKRWRARSRGTAMQIQKKTSHITIILEGEKTKKQVKEGVVEEVVKDEKKGAGLKSQPKSRTRKNIQSKPQKKGLKRMFKRKAF